MNNLIKVGALYKCNPYFGPSKHAGDVLGIPGDALVMLLELERIDDEGSFKYTLVKLLFQEKVINLLYGRDEDFLREFKPVC